MKKCAVVIGVNKTGNLPILSAAVSGATEFAEWARSQNIDATLLTDQYGPVTIADVKSAVAAFVNKNTYTQILIYFAGHGILKGPNDEHWLLSGAPTDSNEAVNVIASRFLASNTGIPYITIISDACRSAPASPLITQVSGGVIFPNVEPRDTQPEIDMFFATKPGDPAYEAKDSEDQAKKYKGIFTNCMLYGLHGNVPEIKSLLKEGNEDSAVIFPYELKKYLDKRVPIAAEQARIDLKQRPSIEVASHPPSYLSKFDNAADVLPGKTTKNMIQELKDDITFPTSLFDNTQFDIKQALNFNAERDFDTDIDNDLEKLYRTTGRESFETQTGFSVIGTLKFDIIINQGRFDVFREGEYMHVRIYPGASNTLLFIGADGTGTPLAILPGFIGTILVEESKIVNVNYVPSRNNDRFDNFMIRSKEVNQRRATAALAARHGAFKISGDSFSILGTASYLRNDKAFDPTLGLYAAYAYAQAGNIKEISSIFKYMAKEPEPVLFDVKLLATISDRSKSKLAELEAPFCPMLTQGWSYLPINQNLFTDQLRELSLQLLPGLWTTFTPKGIETIKRFFN